MTKENYNMRLIFGWLIKIFLIYVRRINMRFLPTYKLIEDCGRCRDCGRNVHDYQVSDELWLKVTGREEGIWCWDCFCDRANRRGIWNLSGTIFY